MHVTTQMETLPDAEMLALSDASEWLSNSFLLRKSYAVMLAQINVHLNSCIYEQCQKGLIASLGPALWKPVIDVAYSSINDSQDLEMSQFTMSTMPYLQQLREAVVATETNAGLHQIPNFDPVTLVDRAKFILQLREAMHAFYSAKTTSLNSASGVRRKARESIVLIARNWMRFVQLPELGPGARELRATAEWVLAMEVQKALSSVRLPYNENLSQNRNVLKCDFTSVSELSLEENKALGYVLGVTLAERGYAKPHDLHARARESAQLADTNVCLASGLVESLQSVGNIYNSVTGRVTPPLAVSSSVFSSYQLSEMLLVVKYCDRLTDFAELSEAKQFSPINEAHGRQYDDHKLRVSATNTLLHLRALLLDSDANECSTTNGNTGEFLRLSKNLLHSFSAFKTDALDRFHKTVVKNAAANINQAVLRSIATTSVRNWTAELTLSTETGEVDKTVTCLLPRMKQWLIRYESALMLHCNIMMQRPCAFHSNFLAPDNALAMSINDGNFSVSEKWRANGLLHSHLSAKVRSTLCPNYEKSSRLLALSKLIDELEWTCDLSRCTDRTSVALLMARAYARILAVVHAVRKYYHIPLLTEKNLSVVANTGHQVLDKSFDGEETIKGREKVKTARRKLYLCSNLNSLLNWVVKVRAALHQQHWASFSNLEHVGIDLVSSLDDTDKPGSESQSNTANMTTTFDTEGSLSLERYKRIYVSHLNIGRSVRTYHTLVTAIQKEIGADVQTITCSSTFVSHFNRQHLVGSVGLSGGSELSRALKPLYFADVDIASLEQYVIRDVEKISFRTKELNDMVTLGNLVIQAAEAATQNRWISLVSALSATVADADKTPEMNAIPNLSNISSLLSAEQSLLISLASPVIQSEFAHLQFIAQEKYFSYVIADALKHGQEYLQDNMSNYCTAEVELLEKTLKSFIVVKTDTVPAAIGETFAKISDAPMTVHTAQQYSLNSMQASPLVAMGWAILALRYAVRCGDWDTLRALLGVDCVATSASKIVTHPVFPPLEEHLVRLVAPPETWLEISTLRLYVEANIRMHIETTSACTADGVVELSGSNVSSKSKDFISPPQTSLKWGSRNAGVPLYVGNVSVATLLNCLKTHERTPRICAADHCIWYTAQRLYAIRLCILQHHMRQHFVQAASRGSRNHADEPNDHAIASTGLQTTRFLLKEIENTQISRIWSGAQKELQLVRGALHLFNCLDNLRNAVEYSGLLSVGNESDNAHSLSKSRKRKALGHAKDVLRDRRSMSSVQVDFGDSLLDGSNLMKKTLKSRQRSVSTTLKLGYPEQSYDKIRTHSLLIAVATLMPMLGASKLPATVSGSVDDKCAATTQYARCAVGLLQLRQAVKAERWDVRSSCESLLATLCRSTTQHSSAPSHRIIRVRVIDPFRDVFRQDNTQNSRPTLRTPRYGITVDSTSVKNEAISAYVPLRAATEILSDNFSALPAGSDFNGTFTDLHMRSIHISNAFGSAPLGTVVAALYLLAESEVGVLSQSEEEVRTIRDSLYERCIVHIIHQALQFSIPNYQCRETPNLSGTLMQEGSKRIDGSPSSDKNKNASDDRTKSQPDPMTEADEYSESAGDYVPLEWALRVVQVLGCPSPLTQKLANTAMFIQALRSAYRANKFDQCALLISRVGDLMAGGLLDSCAVAEIEFVFRHLCTEDARTQVRDILHEQCSAAQKTVISTFFAHMEFNKIPVTSLDFHAFLTPVSTQQDLQLLQVLRQVNALAHALAKPHTAPTDALKSNQESKSQNHGTPCEDAGHDALIRICRVAISINAAVRSTAVARVIAVCGESMHAVRNCRQNYLLQLHSADKRENSTSTLTKNFLQMGKDAFVSEQGYLYDSNNSPELVLAYFRLGAALYGGHRMVLNAAAHARKASLDMLCAEYHKQAESIRKYLANIGFNYAERQPRDPNSSLFDIQDPWLMQLEHEAEVPLIVSPNALEASISLKSVKDSELCDNKDSLALREVGLSTNDVEKASVASDPSNDFAISSFGQSYSVQMAAKTLRQQMQTHIHTLCNTLLYLIDPKGLLVKGAQNSYVNAELTDVCGAVVLQRGGLLYSELLLLSGVLDTAPYPWIALQGSAKSSANYETGAAVLVVTKVMLIALQPQQAFRRTKRHYNSDNGNNPDSNNAFEDKNHDKIKADDNEDALSDSDILVSRQVLWYCLKILQSSEVLQQCDTSSPVYNISVDARLGGIESKQYAPVKRASPSQMAVFMLLGQWLGLLKGHAGFETVPRVKTNLSFGPDVKISSSVLTIPSLLAAAKVRHIARTQLERSRDAACLKQSPIISYALHTLL